MDNHDQKHPRENQITPNLAPPEGSSAIRPEPSGLFINNPVHLGTLQDLEGKNILTAGQFSFDEVVELCKLAAILEKIEIWPYHPLDGKIVVTAFFEASTRTRTSFESAVFRLDGKVISIADGSTTGQAKGESLADIGEMFNAYADSSSCVTPTPIAPQEILKNLRIPLINAGNGSGEHPTQPSPTGSPSSNGDPPSPPPTLRARRFSISAFSAPPAPCVP